MPSALLVEFEGVVADTRGARRAALVRAMRDDGIEVGDEAYEACCTGLGVAGAVRAAAQLDARTAGGGGGVPLDETALDLAALRAERYFAEAIGKGVTLAPGARALLDDAAGRARLGIVTRASRREVEFVLALAGLDAHFECVIAAGDAEPKPSAAPYLRALERLARRRALSPLDVLALEDSATGAIAARAAGVRCIVVGADRDAARALSAADASVSTLEGETLASLAALVSLPPRQAARVP